MGLGQELAPDDAQIGQDFAGYRIERLIGRGGMGRVYLAEHLHLGRKVALKFLAAELADDSVTFKERFIRESRLAASIPHPNIVTVYDAGEHDGQLYIAMQYVDGTDLSSLLAERGKLDAETAVDFLEQIAAALDAAHAEGLVHRDVKPANVLIKDGRCYLTDFGLTKRTEQTRALTRTGQFLGTLEYMAPEQAEGKPVDGRTDVYALGCLLFQCITGSVPFERDETVGTIWAHLSEPPPRASVKADVPTALDGVIERAMAKHPDDRFATAGDMAEAARAALGGVEPESPSKRRRTRAATTTAASRPPVQHAPSRSRALLLGGAAALVAAATVAVIALGGGDDGGDGKPSTSAERFTVRTIPLKSVSFGVAVDPGHSSVWVTGADRGVITRVDAGTGAPVEPPLRLGQDPFGPSVTSTHVWVPLHGEGEVVRLPAARRIGRPVRIRTGGSPSQVATTARTVWIADEAGFAKQIDPDTLRLQRKAVRIGKGARLVVADFTGAWFSNFLRGTVTHLDPEARLQGKPIRSGKGASGLAIAAGHVWVANQGDNNVTRIEARTGRVVGRIPVGRGPFGVAAGAGYVWVTNAGDNTVTRIDPRTARTVGRPIRVGPSPLGIAVGFDAVWVGTAEARAMSVIELKRSRSKG